MLDPEAPTRPHRALRTATEGWSGCLAIGLSLLTLALCSLAAIGLTFAGRRPTPLEHYFPLAPGQSSLYRVTYADGSQGYLSENVVNPNADSLAYAALAGRLGKAMQVQSVFTNWAGSGRTLRRDSFFIREDDRLLLAAQAEAGFTTTADPPIVVWTADVFDATSAAPISGQTTLLGQAVTYRQWAEGEQALTLSNGQAVQARRVVFELDVAGSLFSRSISWLVPGGQPVRSEEYDSQGQLTLRSELINSTRLGGQFPGTPTAGGLIEPDSAAGFFRENAARTGAQPGADLADPSVKIAYRLDLDHAFTASPSYADGRLVVADQSGQVIALDAAQGSPAWSFTAGGPVVAPPTISGGLIYAGAADKTLYALEARDGLYVWSFQMSDNIAASPAVAGGTLFAAGEDRTLYALDALTGAERWRFVAGDRIVSSPAAAGGRVFFGADDALVYALDAATGQLLWRTALDGRVSAAPAVSEDGIVFAVSTGTQAAALDAASGEMLWVDEYTFGYFASPAVGTESVFVAAEDGLVRALDRRTGAVRWKWRGGYGASFVSSPLLLGSLLLAVDDDGQLVVLDAVSGAELHRAALGSSVSASPTWGEDTVFITTQAGEVIALRPQAEGLAFQPLWQQQYGNPDQDLDGSIFAADLIIADGGLYGLARSGALWAIDPETGSGEALARLGEPVDGNPIQVDGVLYASSQASAVLAYDLGQRQLLWRTPVEGTLRYGPAVDAERVYAHSLLPSGSVIYALDRATGAVIWEQRAPAVSGHSTPIVAGDLVLVSADAVLGLDAATGEARWASGPIVSWGGLGADQGAAYVAGQDLSGNVLAALDTATGEELWRRPLAAQVLDSRPAFDPDARLVIAATTAGQVCAFEADGGAERWCYQADSSIQSDIHVQSGVVYFSSFNGTLYALEAAAGRLLSNFKPGTPVNTYAGPVVTPGRVFALHGLTLHALSIER